MGVTEAFPTVQLKISGKWILADLDIDLMKKPWGRLLNTLFLWCADIY